MTEGRDGESAGNRLFLAVLVDVTAGQLNVRVPNDVLRDVAEKVAYVGQRPVSDISAFQGATYPEAFWARTQLRCKSDREIPKQRADYGRRVAGWIHWPRTIEVSSWS